MHASFASGNERLNPVTGLPAPFGPRNPVTCPARAVKLRSSTALAGPKRLVRFTASIMIVYLPW
jgi:hypothetical protein